MVRYEDNCCNCATEDYPCLGKYCPRRNIKVLECDKCGDDAVEKLYIYDGMELCSSCVLGLLEKIEY